MKKLIEADLIERLRSEIFAYIKVLEKKEAFYIEKENESIGDINFWWSGMAESVRSTINDLNDILQIKK